MAFREDREILFDLCSCGRRKPISDYCCQICYLKGHTVTDAQAYGTKGNNIPMAEVVSDPTGDFRKGAKFSAEHFGLTTRERSYPLTIDMGNWPEGMMVEYRKKMYAVEGTRMVEVETCGS